MTGYAVFPLIIGGTIALAIGLEARVGPVVALVVAVVAFIVVARVTPR